MPHSPLCSNNSIKQVPLALQVDRLVGLGCYKEALQIAAMFGDNGANNTGHSLLLHEIDRK